MTYKAPVKDMLFVMKELAGIEAVAQLPGVERVQPLRASPVQLSPTLPALAVLSRPLGDNPAQSLPLVGEPLSVPTGRVAVYISEAVVDLYGVRPGMEWPALSESFRPLARDGHAQAAIFYIAGVWRDYARQSGAVALDRAAWLHLTGDARTSDLVQKLQVARRDLVLEAALAKLDRFDLIILDDITYAHKDQAETGVLFELIARRYEYRSIAIAANQPFSGWDQIFPDKAMTVAAIDRLVHHATILEMNAESFRKRTAVASKLAKDQA
eukprot:gene44675-59627_t